MAVFETARGGILREGLAFDYCDVAVVTNIGDGDHLGLCRHQHAGRTGQGEALHRRGGGARRAMPCSTPTIRWWSRWRPIAPAASSSSPSTPNHPVIVRHRGVGGRAVFVRDGQIVLAEGDREEAVVSLDRLPLTRGGQIAFQVENSLAVDRRRLVAGHPAWT